MKLLKNIWNYFFGKKKATTENVTEELREFHKQTTLIEDEPQEETVITPPQEFRDVSKQNNLIPSRFEGESFEEYKKRRALAKLFLKKKQKGTLVFESQKIILDKVGREKERTKPKTFKGDTSKLK